MGEISHDIHSAPQCRHNRSIKGRQVDHRCDPNSFWKKEPRAAKRLVRYKGDFKKDKPQIIYRGGLSHKPASSGRHEEECSLLYR